MGKSLKDGDITPAGIIFNLKEKTVKLLVYQSYAVVRGAEAAKEPEPDSEPQPEPEFEL